MSKEFKFEERYGVYKISDMACALSFEELQTLHEIDRKILQFRKERGATDLKCLVVESDWPEYKIVENLLRARIQQNETANNPLSADGDMITVELGTGHLLFTDVYNPDQKWAAIYLTQSEKHVEVGTAIDLEVDTPDELNAFMRFVGKTTKGFDALIDAANRAKAWLDTHEFVERGEFAGAPVQTQTVMMPRALTAENGGKGFMSGEFFEEIEHSCHECHDEDVQAECELCEGKGYHIQKVPVSWDTIKAIYAKAVHELGV